MRSDDWEPCHGFVGCNDIDGIVKKFRSRAETNQQLKWMVEEVRATADTLRKSNQELMGKVKVRKLCEGASLTHRLWNRPDWRRLTAVAVAVIGRGSRPRSASQSRRERCITR